MKLRIEHVFDEADSRTTGLQETALGMGECAAFVYDDLLPRSFWMKDVPVDLYVSAVVNGRCVACEFMGKMTTDPHKMPASYIYIESRVPIPEGAEAAMEGGFLVF